MEILKFQDYKTVPDIVHEYTTTIKNDKVPIVIDNGSYMARVGWATNSEPLLQFKNLIAKPRRERSKKDTIEIVTTPQLQLGNDITNIEGVRFQLKTQFDKNVVTHFEAQEHLFDYTFNHLGINTENSIQHPIVLTEAFLNPNSSRQLMSELLFECYEIPGVCYGVDSLFDLHHYKLKTDKAKNVLLINLGYHTCHVIPVIDNKAIFEHTRRLNIGGFHVVSFLHRILQLKYPAHGTSITLSRAEELLHRLCRVALDYKEELKKWSSPEYYDNHVKKIQLPFTANVVNSAVILEQQKERKKELAKRLSEINARKREERLLEDEEKIAQLIDIKEMIECGTEKEIIEEKLAEHQIKSATELEKSISNITSRIERTKQKILAVSNNTDDIDEPVAKQARTRKMSFENEKELNQFLQNTKKKRQEILTKKLLRKQKKQDMAKRRTAAGQERMRIISQLAKKEKGNDDFGLRDEDWDIYKTISKDGGDSDSEAENEKLLEFDEILRVNEFNEIDESVNPEETYQLHIGIEMFRAPELIFKPYMNGSHEAGLSEVIAYVISLLPTENQLELSENVIVTGGLANLPGLKQRLLTDLISVRPFKSNVNVNIMENCSLSAWYGARNFAQSEQFSGSLLTKEMYQEMGGDYFKTHSTSNPYCPTPTLSSIEMDVNL